MGKVHGSLARAGKVKSQVNIGLAISAGCFSGSVAKDGRSLDRWADLDRRAFRLEAAERDDDNGRADNGREGNAGLRDWKEAAGIRETTRR